MWHEFDRITSRLFFRKQFFPKGWGDIGQVAANYGLGVNSPRWDDEATLAAFRKALVRSNAPAAIDVTWMPETRTWGNSIIRRGTFATPVNRALLPEACRTAHVEWVAPANHTRDMPVCILFPATGEQGFLSRRLMALALARQGIASLILEVAFYGVRRPPGQDGALLNHVSDLVALMDTTIEEGRALLAWLRYVGYSRLAVSGISMGGSVSALVTARSDFPLACIGMIPANAVGPVYAEGLLSNYVAWDVLRGPLRTGIEPRRVMHDYLSVFDVSNYPPPAAIDAACFLSATDDGCVPGHNTAQLHAHWPGARIEWITGGHSSAVVTGWNRYRKAIVRGATGTC